MLNIEVWAESFNDDGTPCDTTITIAENASAKSMMEPGARLLHAFKAKDWDAGCTEAHRLLDREPYVPLPQDVRRWKRLVEFPVTDPVREFMNDSLLLVLGFDPELDVIKANKFDLSMRLNAGTIITIMRRLRDDSLPTGMELIEVKLPDGQLRWIYSNVQNFRRIKAREQSDV